jgi:hypothetical protein
VTKKRDLSGFYRNLEKNIAMGGKHSDSSEEEETAAEAARMISLISKEAA